MLQSLTLDPGLLANPFHARPIVARVAYFNDAAVVEFRTAMQAASDAGQSIVPVVIASYGGYVDALNEMVSAIEEAKARGAIVATHTPSHAMSCGSVLLAAGTPGYRYASPVASVMVHQVTGRAFGKASDLEVDARDVAATNKRLLSMLSRYCGKKKDYWADCIRKAGNTDIYLDADDAKDEGIVDHVGTPTLDVRVRVELALRAG